MSSYRSSSGAWDGGPPGAEAEYAAHQPPPLTSAPAAAFPPQPRAMPTTDPWTGVSYTHYGAPPNYDYQAYQSSGYGYNYDSSYYQRPDGGYYNKYPDSRPGNPPAGAPSYDYTSGSQDRSGSPSSSRPYERRCRSDSRSVSPYDKRERTHSHKRDSSYEGSRRSESRSRSVKSKRAKYSSSDHSSSRSRSHSRTKRPKKRMSVSSHSSGSERSYKNTPRGKARKHSMTPPFKRNSRSQQQSKSQRTPSPKRSRSRSPKSNDELRIKDSKSNSSNKDKYKRDREVTTPPPKTPSKTPPHKMSDRSSVTPPKSYQKHDHSVTPPKNYRGKRSAKERSLTPPKSYARSQSSSSSKSRSRSVTPRQKRRRSRTPKSRRSSSRSSSHSSSRCSLSKSRRRTKPKSSSNHRSRTKSRSRRRSLSKSRSRSRNRSNSKGRRKCESSSHSKSRSKSHSRSRSGSPSEDERRGQFTVADRKRFWKLHRDRIEEKVKAKSPPPEIKPPPDAIEKTKVDDVEYGDPPEVEGPNFAELLPSRDQLLQQGPSTSKGGKNIPIAIKNDGSFLEMFKKMQEETKKIEDVKKPEIKKPLPFIGKRRGGRVLKTGMVKKAKAIDEQTADNTPKDAWSLYMQEVKKYRETSCEEERKTRPLVK